MKSGLRYHKVVEHLSRMLEVLGAVSSTIKFKKRHEIIEYNTMIIVTCCKMREKAACWSFLSLPVSHSCLAPKKKSTTEISICYKAD